MERVNMIIKHPTYQICLGKIQEWEKDKDFCKHDMSHFMEVARLAMILNVEEELNVEKDMIYAVALLHDIGRFREYENGLPHDKTSAPIAERILDECGFTQRKISLILSAILHHRDSSVKDERSLRGLLYRADKMSRLCFACPWEKDCSWGMSKKNMQIYR